MNKNFLVSVVLTGIFSGLVASAGPTPALPANYESFQKLTAEEMKALPDYKWPTDKKVTEKDIQNKSPVELILLKNSIYAQYGFHFTEKSLDTYFSSRSWYKPVDDTFNVDKLSSVSRENVNFFMKAQASIKNGGREAASSQEDKELERYYRSQMAYNLFLMGFCTYDTTSEKKAGMLVFDPSGKARLFHSAASRSAFEPYAYEGYFDGVPGENETLLMDVTWSIKIEKQKATVIVNVPKSVSERYRTEKGKTLIAEGDREVLSIDMSKQGPNMYPFTKTRQCKMSPIKKP